MNTDYKSLFQIAGVVLGGTVGVPIARFIWGLAVEWGAQQQSIKNTSEKVDAIGSKLSTHVEEVRESFGVIQEAASKTRGEFQDIKRSLEQQAKDQQNQLTEWTDWRRKMDGHVVRIDKRIDAHDRRVGPENRRRAGRAGGKRKGDVQADE